MRLLEWGYMRVALTMTLMADIVYTGSKDNTGNPAPSLPERKPTFELWPTNDFSETNGKFPASKPSLKRILTTSAGVYMTQADVENLLKRMTENP